MDLKPNLLISLAIFWDWKASGLKFWLQTREDSGSLNGKLEFPGGKVEEGESLEQAMRREVKEEVGVEIKEEPVKFFKIYSHEYEKVNVILNCFLVGKSDLPGGEWFQYSTQEELEKLDDKIPPANYQIFKDLSSKLMHLSLEDRKILLWN